MTHDADSILGIRRQPWYSIPRDLCEERVERRTSFLDNGQADQRAHGQHSESEQGEDQHRRGPECPVRACRRLLLNVFSRLHYGSPVTG